MNSFTPRHPAEAAHACCVPRNPRANSPERSRIAGEPGAHLPRKVIKGGSHLCAPSYCLRYRLPRPARETVSTAPPAHLGFRCISRDGPSAMG